MIKQIFKIIWNERKINSWIVAELILIFTILWFCCDYLYLVGSRYVEPLGFDITNTYRVNIGTISTSVIGEVSEEDKINAFDDIIKRIKANPQIENVSFSANSTPYNGGWLGQNYKIDSITVPNLWTKMVSPDFLDVFRIKFLQGRNVTPDEVLSQKAIVIGNNKSGLLEKKVNIMSIDSVYMDNEAIFKVGVVDKVKRSEFESYGSIVYLPITTTNLIQDLSWGIEIAMRVKPEADSKDFPEKFITEMRSQLDVKPFFLIDIKPLSDQRTHYMGMTGTLNKIKSTLSVLLFLIINISLGIMGTFWLRIESRRSEIGLQMALGASRKRIKKTYIIEAIFLLLIASIIGFILAINIQATGVLDNFGLPMISGNRQYMEILDYQILVNYLLSLLLLIIIIVISVWYPSQKASKISPASVLRGE